MELLETRGPYFFGDWKVTQIVESEVEAFMYDFLLPGVNIDDVKNASPKGKSSHISEKGMILISNQLFVLQNKNMYP